MNQVNAEESGAQGSHWPLSVLGGMASVLNLALPLALVRICTQTEMGHYKIFFLYLVLVPWFFLTAGITNGLGHWGGRPQAERTLAFRTSWSLLLICATLVTVLGILGGSYFSAGLGWDSLTKFIFIWGAAATILSSFFEEASIASGKIWRGALFSSSFEVIRNLSLLTSAFYFRQIRAVFLTHTIIITIKVLIGTFWGIKEGFQRPLWTRSSLRQVLSYAGPVSLSAALAILTNYADQLLLSRTLDTSTFALYTLGCLAIPPLMIFEQAVNRVLIPKLSQAFHNSLDYARVLYSEAMSELSWILIPACIGLITFSDDIVVLLFTKRYLPCAEYLRLYSFYYLMFTIPFDACARARAQGTWILKQLVAFSAITVLGVHFGSQWWGAKGALLAFLTSQYLMRITALIRVSRQEGWPLRSLIPWRDGLRYIFFALTAAVVSQTLFRAPIGDHAEMTRTTQALSFFLKGAMFVFIYAFGTLGASIKRRAHSSPRPRVLILTQYLGLGGLERVVLNLATGLKKVGTWDSTVFVYDEIPGSPTLHAEFDAASIPVITCIKDSGLSWKVIRRLVQEIFQSRTSVIHSHDLGALIYAVIAKWLLFGGIKIVHTQHSFIHLEKSKNYKHYERFFSFFADKICSVSESIQSQYDTVGISPSQIEVIPNGVVFPDRAARTRLEQMEWRSWLIADLTEPEAKDALYKLIEKPWILCMARVHPKKGQEQVAQVWEKMSPQARTNSVLIFVGAETSAGALAVLKKRIQTLPQNENVIYAGFTKSPAKWLAATDIFISGSEFEGMPLGPIEAVGSGTATLVSEIPGHSMLPSYAKRFALDQPAQGARILEEFISAFEANPESPRKELWEKGATARETWGVEAMARQYQSRYRQ